MLYRRKILLALVQALGDRASKTDFQKHLFLFTRSQLEPTYDFFPYKYGCYSMVAEADRGTLIKQNKLEDDEEWTRSQKVDYVGGLKEQDRKALLRHRKLFGNIAGQDLVRYVYQNYPYYAINSIIAADILTSEELAKVEHAKIPWSGAALFTIGYEGKNIEKYLNQLIQKGVNVLCDVRRNPLSRKYGFSQRSLQRAVERLGIEYLHLPGLGIPSSKRKALQTQEDYNLLFDEYERDVLPSCNSELNTIFSLLISEKRVALTCFELRPRQCHRGRVANFLLEDPRWEYNLYHI